MRRPAGLGPHFYVYEEQLRRLHSLIAAGQHGSEEARELRREMEVAGIELTEEEVIRARGISADLYMLSDREVYQPVQGRRPTPEELFELLQAAWEQEDWETALNVLRQGPTGLSPAQVAYLRARCYDELGHTATAALFMSHAARLEPQDDTYAFLAMDLLQRSAEGITTS